MRIDACVVWLVLVLAIQQLQAERVIGCGGFVELSSELARVKPSKVDFQFLRMELVTLDGIVKDSTECAPNGYYFLPIYEKGKFKIEIKGPEGYAFAPTSVTIEQGKCDQDINFQLTGFTLSGKVVGSVLSSNSSNCDASIGPEGVTIQLKGNEVNLPARATMSIQGGHYLFTNVIPGSYSLTASHQSWGFLNSEVSARLEWGNMIINEPIVVSGYNVEGRVATANDESVGDVNFMLFPASNYNIPSSLRLQCQQLELPIDGGTDKTPLCVVKSDKDGHFVFRNVPCGSYQIVPFYKSSQTTFDVAPARQDVVVGQGDTALKETFHVVGFSVIGRVIDSLGDGISDVAIIVDAQERTVTDAMGYYTLDKVPVSSTMHDIEASKDHLFFDSLLQYRLTPSQPRLPDIRVVSYHLCGRIGIEQRPPVVYLATHREVLVSGVSRKEERRSAEPSGSYCFELQPGEYTISPVVSAEEQKAGLVFTPSSITVSIGNAPLLDVNFNQVLVTLSGVVHCIESPCDPAISIVLTARDRATRLTTGLGIGIVPSGEGTAGSRNEDYFVFRDVFPGIYEIQVSRDAWCWENSSYILDVQGTTGMSSGGRLAESKQHQYVAPDFVQSGYILTTLVSHDITLLLDLDNTVHEQRVLNITKGTNRFCLKKPGTYTLTPRSCYRFKEDSYKYDTSAPHVVDLIITHYMVYGLVIVPLPDPPTSLPIRVAINGDDSADGRHEQTRAALVSTSTAEATYKWSVWGVVSDTITASPLPYPPLLFYPSSQSVSILTAECPPPMPPFIGRVGKTLVGGVSPALGDVKIQVINATDGTSVMTIFTLPNGSYSAGPLYDDTPYRVVAEKEGFELTAQDSYHFVARKLAMITASVKVAVSELERHPLQGVLLSLSGQGYRNNNATHPNGQFSFTTLSSGAYFLRPLLKEYVFEPTSMSIEIGEGEEKDVSFLARRVAYSVYGSVRSLNGEGEKWVAVEAVGPRGEREETQTDAQGVFRLRGLLPGVTYTIAVRLHADRIERASPPQHILTMPYAEVHDVHFVVFRRPPKADLTGEVLAEPSLLSSLWVELYPVGSNSKVLAVRRVGPAGFFDFGAVTKENEEYLLRVATSLSRQLYSFSTVEQTVVAQPPGVHVRLGPFTASPQQTDRDIPHTPLYALAVALVGLGIALYYRLRH